MKLQLLQQLKKPALQLLQLLLLQLTELGGKRPIVKEGAGCAECRGTGFRGVVFFRKKEAHGVGHPAGGTESAH